MAIFVGKWALHLHRIILIPKIPIPFREVVRGPADLLKGLHTRRRGRIRVLPAFPELHMRVYACLLIPSEMAAVPTAGRGGAGEALLLSARGTKSSPAELVGGK